LTTWVAAGSRTASASYQYLALFVSRNRYSWLRVGRSVMLSGIGFGFAHTMSLRSHQPAAWRARATRHGIPTRSFGLRPPTAVAKGLSLKARSSFTMFFAARPFAAQA